MSDYKPKGAKVGSVKVGDLRDFVGAFITNFVVFKLGEAIKDKSTKDLEELNNFKFHLEVKTFSDTYKIHKDKVIQLWCDMIGHKINLKKEGKVFVAPLINNLLIQKDDLIIYSVSPIVEAKLAMIAAEQGRNNSLNMAEVSEDFFWEKLNEDLS